MPPKTGAFGCGLRERDQATAKAGEHQGRGAARAGVLVVSQLSPR